MVSVWRREASVRTSKGDCERSKNRGEAMGKELVCWAADTDEDATGLGKSLGNVLSSWAGVGGIANRYAGGGKVWAEKQTVSCACHGLSPSPTSCLWVPCCRGHWPPQDPLGMGFGGVRKLPCGKRRHLENPLPQTLAHFTSSSNGLLMLWTSVVCLYYYYYYYILSSVVSM